MSRLIPSLSEERVHSSAGYSAEGMQWNFAGDADAGGSPPALEKAFPLPAKAAVIPVTPLRWEPTVSPLSVDALVERLSQAIRQQIPCIVSLAHRSVEHWYQGHLTRVTWRDGRFEMNGPDFKLRIREASLGRIALIHAPNTPETSLLVEIQNRSERVLARVYPLLEPDFAVKWRNVMAPDHEASEPVAPREFQTNPV